MKRLVFVLLLLCAPSLFAQSLGDVAREQRAEKPQSKAKHVFTNDDVSAPMAPAADAVGGDQKPADGKDGQPKPADGAKSAKPASESKQKDPERVRQERQIAEIKQRLQALQVELRGLAQQQSQMASHPGDATNRIQRDQELSAVKAQVEAKQREVNAANNELSEAVERYNRSSVIR